MSEGLDPAMSTSVAVASLPLPRARRRRVPSLRDLRATVALKREHQQGSLVLDQEAAKAAAEAAEAAEAELNQASSVESSNHDASAGATKPANPIAQRRRSVQLMTSLGSMGNEAHNSVSYR